MHTESLFKTDNDFFSFTKENLSEVRFNQPLKDNKPQIGRLVDSDCTLAAAYEIVQRKKQTEFLDALVLPLEPISSCPRVPCRIRPMKFVQGMRQYIELSSPLFRNDYIAIDTFKTLGVDDDKEPYNENAFYHVRPIALALSLNLNKDEVFLKITKSPRLEYRRIYESGFNESYEKFNMYYATSFMSENYDEAPEVYSYRGVVDDVEKFVWRERLCYKLLMRLHTADEQLPLFYTLVVSDAVLKGHTPRIGESISGVMALYLSNAERLDANDEFLVRYKKACEDVSPDDFVFKDSGPKKKGKQTKKIYPWGVVSLIDGEAVSFEPNEHYPTETELGPLPLQLPEDDVKGAVSHFRSDKLPYFCFYDEFVRKLPSALTLCPGTRSDLNRILSQIKCKRGMKWNKAQKRGRIGIFQASETPDKKYVFYHFCLKLDVSNTRVSLLALYNRKKHELIRYTLSYKEANVGCAGLEVCSAYSNRLSAEIPLRTMKEVKEYLPKMQVDDFVILINPVTSALLQFWKNKKTIYTEFQFGDIAYQFGVDMKSNDDVLKAIDLFNADDSRFFSVFKWRFSKF